LSEQYISTSCGKHLNPSKQSQTSPPFVHLDAGPWVKPEQVKGTTVEQFIAAAQDRTRNALQTSLLAGFNAWKEQLRADEVAFESDKILYPD